MKRNFKSHKITSDKKVVHKPSRYILGPRYVQVLQLIITHRPVFDDNAASPTAAQKPKNTKKLAITARKPKNSKPGGIKKKITTPDCLRLWLRVIPTCTEVDAVYFSKRVLGEGKTAQAVSFYSPSLRLTHPQFSDPTKSSPTLLYERIRMMLSLKLVRPLLFNRSIWRRTPKHTRRKQRIWPTKIRWQRLCLELEQLGIPLPPQKQFSNQKNLVQFRHLLSPEKAKASYIRIPTRKRCASFDEHQKTFHFSVF